jgi:hypothetical protein
MSQTDARATGPGTSAAAAANTAEPASRVADG